MSDVPEKAGIVDEEFIDIRTEVARVLVPSAFPGTASQLKAVAADNFAEDVAALLDGLPPDQVYENTQQVVDALGVNPSE
jgi:hypothetical protein